MFSSCDKVEVDVVIRYKNNEIAYVSTNKGISNISVCREANPIVSPVKEKSIDKEDYSASKYVATNETTIGNPFVRSIKDKNSNRENYLARKQTSKQKKKHEKWTNDQRDKRTNRYKKNDKALNKRAHEQTSKKTKKFTRAINE